MISVLDTGEITTEDNKVLESKVLL